MMGFFGGIKEKVGTAAEAFRKKITLPILPRPVKIDQSRKELLERQVELATTMRGMTNHRGWALYVKEQEDVLSATIRTLQDPLKTKTMDEVRFLQAEASTLVRELTRVETTIQRGIDAARELAAMDEKATPVTGALDLPLEPDEDEDNG